MLCNGDVGFTAWLVGLAFSTYRYNRVISANLRHELDLFGLIAEKGALQRETCVRGNNSKEKIKHADFPTEAPESNSDKY